MKDFGFVASLSAKESQRVIKLLVEKAADGNLDAANILVEAFGFPPSFFDERTV